MVDQHRTNAFRTFPKDCSSKNVAVPKCCPSIDNVKYRFFVDIHQVETYLLVKHNIVDVANFE
jgi:hypothetical protein